MLNKMEENKEWGDAESWLTAAPWDSMQSRPRAMNEGGEEREGAEWITAVQVC